MSNIYTNKINKFNSLNTVDINVRKKIKVGATYDL